MAVRCLPPLFLLTLTLNVGLAAESEVQVPLVVDKPHLERLLSDALGLDEQGRGRLEAERCTYLDLSDLRLETVDKRLALSLGLSATSGVMVLGHCRGPGPASSRLHLELKPGINASGTAVTFTTQGAELRRPDGSEGLLSRPSRLLAESLVMPRLDQTIIDVSGLLDAIDSLIKEFKPDIPDSGNLLNDRVRLSGVASDEQGLAAQLTLKVRQPPPATASTEPALQPSELVEWERVEDELDGFLTVLVARLASQVDNRDLQLDFLALLLDTRQRIAVALLEDNPVADPVRLLFMDAWNGLRPLLARLEPLDVIDDRDLRLAGFIAAGDALAALDALGPEFGLEISRDGLRRLARLLMAGEAPVSFTPLPLNENTVLRSLFGLDPHGPATGPALPSLQWWQRLLPLAHASTLPLAESLRGVVASPATLDEYLDLVARLLDAVYSEHMASGSRIPADYRDLFGPLVQATAWRESCWRHYVGPIDEPRVIRSSMGAIGMMQIMGRVWRGVYDVERLEAEIEYNIGAGIEILEHYLVDYALRRGEHQHPGGADNLVRATYAAYNGG
ncbi:MAG: lytic transglycosylase domain-containing protein, partial [Wenzhouxiangella sp.]